MQRLPPNYLTANQPPSPSTSCLSAMVSYDRLWYRTDPLSNHLQAGDGFFVRSVTVPEVAMLNLAEPVKD